MNIDNLKIYDLKEKQEYIPEVAKLEYLEWADNKFKNSELRIENKENKK